MARLATLASLRCLNHEHVSICSDFAETSRGRARGGRQALDLALTICLLLPPFAMDFEEDDDIRGWLPGLGDMVRAGTVGGGPGSAAGDLR